MKIERFRWIASLIAAHPNHKLVGRTRLQKELYLLQRLGMPSDYDYVMYHYGPYSEGVQADLRLLEKLDIVTESEIAMNGKNWSEFKTEVDAYLTEMEQFNDVIQQLDKTETTVLELAATYDAFCQLGLSDERAMSALLRKKAEKCTDENVQNALNLLKELKLAS